MALKDDQGNTLLHEAAISGNSQIVRILMDRGLCLETENINGTTPMDSAVLNGNLEIIKEFIHNYEALRHHQLLDNAITAKEDHIAKFLVMNTPKYDSVDSFGNTSMHDAVQKGQL